MIKRILTLVILIPFFGYAQYERPGSATGQFLKIGVSARAAGMGGAYIAIAEGAEGTYYNPAVLPYVKGISVSLMHNQWFAGVKHNFAALAYNVPNIGAFGLSVTALYTDPMKVRTPLQPEGTGETFYTADYRFGLSYARSLTNSVTFGGTISYLNMKLYEGFVENAVSADIAVLYNTGFRDFRFGLKIANFGSSVTFVNEEYPLPLNFTFGLGMNGLEMESQKVIVSLAAMKPNDGQTLLMGGMEWTYLNILSLRTGYKFNDDTATYSFGAGFNLNIKDYISMFDYSYSTYGLLGESHRFGININL